MSEPQWSPPPPNWKQPKTPLSFSKGLLIALGVLLGLLLVLVGGILGGFLVSGGLWIDNPSRYPPPSYSASPVPSTVPPTEVTPLVLTFTGLGPLQLGMTADEARAIDPSVAVAQDPDQYGNDCFMGGNADAELAFNPDGRLAYISPHDEIATAAGIHKGSTGREVQRAYHLKNAAYPPEGFAGIYIDSDGREDVDGKYPAIGIYFADSGKPLASGEYEIASAIVQSIYLEGGQECFD